MLFLFFARSLIVFIFWIYWIFNLIEVFLFLIFLKRKILYFNIIYFNYFVFRFYFELFFFLGFGKFFGSRGVNKVWGRSWIGRWNFLLLFCFVLKMFLEFCLELIFIGLGVGFFVYLRINLYILGFVFWFDCWSR